MGLEQSIAVGVGVFLLGGIAFLLIRRARWKAGAGERLLAELRARSGAVRHLGTDLRLDEGCPPRWVETLEAETEGAGRAYIEDMTVDAQDKMVEVRTPTGTLRRTIDGLDFEPGFNLIGRLEDRPADWRPPDRSGRPPRPGAPTWSCASCGQKNEVADSVDLRCQSTFLRCDFLRGGDVGGRTDQRRLRRPARHDRPDAT